MEIEDYKPNSNNSKKEISSQKNDNSQKKKPEKIVTGNVKVQKKNGIQKFADVFVSEDISTVGNYIFTDVIVPAVKNLIYEIGSKGLDQILYGNSGNNGKDSRASKISYGDYYSMKDNKNSDPVHIHYDFQNLVFETRAEATDVLDRMYEILSMYNMVTVSDLYDIAGKTCSYTGNNYGWYDLSGCTIVRVRDRQENGYMIKFPKVQPLN